MSEKPNPDIFDQFMEMLEGGEGIAHVTYMEACEVALDAWEEAWNQCPHCRARIHPDGVWIHNRPDECLDYQ